MQERSTPNPQNSKSDIMNQTIISNQTIEAKQQFPNLMCSNSIYDFSIQLNGYNFQISLSGAYPNSAPIVKLNGQQFSVPIVKYWQSIFTLTDVLTQLSVFSQTTRPSDFYDVFPEIQSQLQQFPQNKLCSEEGRKEILFSNQNYVKAFQVQQETNKLIQQENAKTNELNQQIARKSSELDKQVKEQQYLSQQYMQNSQAITEQLNQNKRVKVAEIKNQISKLDNDIQGIKMQLSKGMINLDTFLNQYNQINQNRAYNKKLISLIEQTIF